jgi:hypothetical protein
VPDTYSLPHSCLPDPRQPTAGGDFTYLWQVSNQSQRETGGFVMRAVVERTDGGAPQVVFDTSDLLRSSLPPGEHTSAGGPIQGQPAGTYRLTCAIRSAAPNRYVQQESYSTVFAIN